MADIVENLRATNLLAPPALAGTELLRRREGGVDLLFGTERFAFDIGAGYRGGQAAPLNNGGAEIVWDQIDVGELLEKTRLVLPVATIWLLNFMPNLRRDNRN